MVYLNFSTTPNEQRISLRILNSSWAVCLQRVKLGNLFYLAFVPLHVSVFPVIVVRDPWLVAVLDLI